MTKKCSACSCELQFMRGNCCDFSRGLNWGMTGRLEYVQGKFRALHKVAFQCLSQYMSLSCFTLSCPRPKPFVYRGIVSVQSTSGKHQQKVIPQQRSYMPCYWYSALLEVGVCHPYSSERERNKETHSTSVHSNLCPAEVLGMCTLTIMSLSPVFTSVLGLI